MATGDELERGPFGRALSLLLHRLPRGDAEDWDWEIERGFHLEVLSESLFELNLRPRGKSPASDTLPILVQPGGLDDSGVARLLVWQRHGKDEDWAEFASTLAAGKNWRAGLILSHSSERGAAFSSYMSRRFHWKGVTCPVVQIFQESAPSTFFTVEKNLFCLGRVGRRVERYSNLRRFLPW